MGRLSHSRGRAPRVLLGVTGGIAAYKALELVRLFRKEDWDVTVVMTKAAKKFVGPESFAALSGRPVAHELFPGNRRKAVQGAVEHVDLAVWADLVVVAPATANILGKLVSGVADDLLSTLLLAIPAATRKGGRVLFAPAMNVNMWQNPAVQANVRQLRQLGYRFIAPAQGELACGAYGAGRLPEPAVIMERCRKALAPQVGNRQSGIGDDLTGVRVLVTSGRTEEGIDPVRVITNRSSGKMGAEIAAAFVQAGASVTLVAGPVSVPLPQVETVHVRSTDEMLEAVLGRLQRTDILVMCAAVADYRPRQTSRAKVSDRVLVLELERTPDILAAVSRRKHRAVVVGFSLDDAVARARTKLREKRLDLIVANPLDTPDSDRIRPRLLFPGGRTRTLAPRTKYDFARELVDVAAGLYRRRRNR